MLLAADYYFDTIFLTFLITLACISLAQADISLKNGKKSSTKLDPVLRKALLKALTNLEKEAQENGEESATTEDPNDEYDFNTTVESETSSPDEALEESTNDDGLTEQVHYHSFVADGNNSTDDGSEEEIIKTIIIKRPKTTLTPPFEEDNKVDNFDEPNPILENNDFAIDSVQLARSVVTTTVDANEFEKKTEKKKKDDKKKVSLPKRQETTERPTTTTPESVTNEDGENIEKVKEGDVKIYKAIDVAALTVVHDNDGVPRQVIPLEFRSPNPQTPAKPIMAFNIDPVTTTTPQTTIEPLTTSTVFESTASSTQVSSTTPVPLNTEPFFDTAAIEQRQREIEQQIAYLREQQRQQEELLRRSQALREQEFLKRQQQLLYEQRLRVEEEHRLRLQAEHERRQKLEQERFQQFQSQQQFPPQQQQQFPSQQQQQQRNSVIQVVPSVQLPNTQTVSINVEQQLPVKPAVDFHPRNNIQFVRQPQIQQNSANIQITKSNEQPFIQQISTVPQLPQKPAQNFLIIQPSNVPLPPLVGPQQQLPIKPFQNFHSNSFHNGADVQQRQQITSNVQITQSQSLNPIHTADIVAHQLTKNRVFRNDAAQTGNFGFNQQQNFNQQRFQQQNQQRNNFRASQPLNFQPSSIDQQNIQNLLFNSGITFNNPRSAEEDFNIITKVLALNHGIEPSQTNNLGLGFGQQQQRFRRNL
ncbi:probable basic-leucine zipper transcription factor Q [Culicoides brevitarsis]|uniref:probable basic-leucine zipper transcription factor Q n=1 Tax=Culicoides brevitarsis TaxID=469753 RepID=UPI00307B28DB